MRSSPEHLQEVVASALEPELWKLPGKWVGIVDDRIEVVADSYRDVVRELDARSIENALIQAIPTDGAIHVF